MSTGEQYHNTKGVNHTPEQGYLPGETFPNYQLGHDGGNATYATGLNDEPYDRDYEDAYMHPFEVSVTDGNLYVAPGTVEIKSFDANGGVMEPAYPVLGGQPIGPLGDDGLISVPVDSDSTRLVIQVSCEEPQMYAWTNEEYDQYIEDKQGFLVVVAQLDISSESVVTGYNAQGVPQTTNQIEASEITQLVHSDVYVNIDLGCDSDSGDSGDSDSGGSGDSGDSGGSGTSKDSAIVPVNWTKTGFAALYCVEAPDVRFEDTIVVERPKWARNWSVDTCGRFRSVLEDGSMEVVAYTADKPVPVGFSIDEQGVLTVRTSCFPFHRPNRLVVKLAGIRRGFAGVKFEEKTKAEFDANEKRLTLDL